jgi:hypothetical protein
MSRARSTVSRPERPFLPPHRPRSLPPGLLVVLSQHPDEDRPQYPVLLAVDQELGKVRGAAGAATHRVKAVSAYQGIVTLSRAHRVGSSPRPCC